MILVALGGNHKSNQQWIETLSEHFADDFNVVTISYDHWVKPGGVINLNMEMDKLRYLVSVEECLVIAKSAGILLALMATDAGILRPAKCVFIGLPIRFAIKHKIDIKKLLAAHKIPSLIIQNDQDPIGSFEEVSELISLLNSDDFEIQRLVGSNHDYEDYQAISRGVYKLIESES